MSSRTSGSPGGPYPASAAATGAGSLPKTRAHASRHATSHSRGPRNVSSKSFHNGPWAVWMTLRRWASPCSACTGDVEGLEAGGEPAADAVEQRGVVRRDHAGDGEPLDDRVRLAEHRVLGEVAVEAGERLVAHAQAAAGGARVDGRRHLLGELPQRHRHAVVLVRPGIDLGRR